MYPLRFALEAPVEGSVAEARTPSVKAGVWHYRPSFEALSLSCLDDEFKRARPNAISGKDWTRELCRPVDCDVRCVR